MSAMKRRGRDVGGLTADEALDLAERFHLLAQALARYRFARWDDLTGAQRRVLEDREWALLTSSSELVTQAVGLVLESSAATLAALRQATGDATAAFARTEEVRRVIRVATAVVALAAAVAAKNPGAVAANVQVVLQTAGAGRRPRNRGPAGPSRRRAPRGSAPA